MTLEQIAKTYGKADYYDQHTGYIYLISDTKPLDDGKLEVPVVYEDRLIGYVTMENVF